MDHTICCHQVTGWHIHRVDLDRVVDLRKARCLTNTVWLELHQVSVRLETLSAGLIKGSEVRWSLTGRVLHCCQLWDSIHDRFPPPPLPVTHAASKLGYTKTVYSVILHFIFFFCWQKLNDLFLSTIDLKLKITFAEVSAWLHGGSESGRKQRVGDVTINLTQRLIRGRDDNDKAGRGHENVTGSVRSGQMERKPSMSGLFPRDIQLWRPRLALALSGYCGPQGRTDFNLGHSEENVNKCGHLKPRHTQMRKSDRSLALFMLFSFPVQMSDSPLNQNKGFIARGLKRLDFYAVPCTDSQWAVERKPFFSWQILDILKSQL